VPDTPDSAGPQRFNLTEQQAERVAKRYDLSPPEFRALEEEAQKRLLLRIEYDYMPLRRAEYFSRALRNDDGHIPPDAYSTAREELESLRALSLATGGRLGGLSVGQAPQPGTLAIEEFTARLSPDNTGWKSLGPGNIGGRIRSILIDPANPQKIYIGSVGGGVWISTDGGQSWQPGNDLMANLAVCSMAMDPTTPATIYAGTGEGYWIWPATQYKTDFIQGDGIFKSTDGWVWQQLASTKPTDTNKDFLWVKGLSVNSDGSAILAGTSAGIFRSTDGGTTWSKCLAANVGNLSFNPTDQTKAVAAMLAGGGIYYSADGGISWRASAKPAGAGSIGRIQVCYAVNNPSVVYASVERNGSEIWRSIDGGQTFTKRGSTFTYLGTQGYYDNIIWAGDPTNPDFIIVGGVDLYKSIDGGNTLVQISDWRRSPSSAHADHHAIVSAPGYNGTTNKSVYFGNDGGLYMTADVTTVGTDPQKTNGWVSLNSKLPITQFYSGVGNAATDTVMGGAQDNGTLRYTPGAGANAWNSVYGGDGGYVASDPTSSNNYFGEYVYLQIFRNTSGGATNSSEYICGRYWDGANWVWKPVPYTIPDAQNGSAPFIAPFVLDPNNANRLLGGGLSLWRTMDPLAPNSPTSGPTWTAIKPTVGSAIAAIAVAPGNSSLVLVGHENGQIYKSVNATDATPTWTRIDTNGINAARMCTWLAIDKNDNNRFYATFGGFQSDNVWTSTNAGGSWTSIGGRLPKVPVRCFTMHPQNPEWIYIGTEVGIFASEDRGQNWSPGNEGPTNCVVYQLFWTNNALGCATHGRGMFSIDVTIYQNADLVLSADIGGTLTAFNPQTGTTATSYAMPSGQIYAAPLIDGRAAYCAYAQPFKIVKFNDVSNLSGGPAWQTGLKGSVKATPALVKATFTGDKDLIYTMAANGKLYVLDAATGAQQWTLQVVPSGEVGPGVDAYSNQVMNQWVYIATEKGLYAVNTLTRTVGWSTNYVCQAPPLLASDTVFAPAQDGNIYAVGARTGAVKWSYNTGAAVASTPVWVLGSVIAGNQAGLLVGLDYDSGALQFSADFAGEQIQAIAADGTDLYFVGNAVQGHIYGYQLNIAGTTRAITQTWQSGLPLGAARAPQVVGNFLYVTTMDKKLMAFDSTNGSSRWDYTLAKIAMAAPALVYA
jgi:outer membrane protein assembly factor BamB